MHFVVLTEAEFAAKQSKEFDEMTTNSTTKEGLLTPITTLT